MKGRITKTSVDSLAKGDFISDSEIRGFIARRLPSGTVTFGYQYTAKNGQRRWLKLGLLGSVTVEEARTEAKKKAGAVAGGVDPAAEAEVEQARSTNTVGFVLDQWVEKYAKPKLRSADAIAKTFDRHVRPEIGGVVIYDVTRKNIADMLDKVTEGAGPVAADRTLAHLRSAFNWWRIRDDHFITQPIVKGMNQVTIKSRARKRMLDLEEIRDVWQALDEIAENDAPQFYPAFVRALLLTACRRDEVADMSTHEFRDGDWTIPESRYKTKRDHFLPLPDAVIKMLPKRDEGYIFSSDGGKTPFSGFSKAKRALDAAIKALRKREGRKPMPAWQLRDLRRTARSRMVGDLKINDQHAKAVLGHVIPGIDGVYNRHEFAEEKREALARWAAYITNIGNPAGNVVAFPEKKSGRAATAARRSRTKVSG